MTLSDRPHLGAIAEMSRAEDSFDMAGIIVGADVTAESFVIIGNANINSPLLVCRCAVRGSVTASATGDAKAARGKPEAFGAGRKEALSDARY